MNRSRCACLEQDSVLTESKTVIASGAKRSIGCSTRPGLWIAASPRTRTRGPGDDDPGRTWDRLWNKAQPRTEETMKVGVIGSGVVAQTLGAGFLKHGHEVAMGTREPAKLEEWSTK